MRKFLLCCTFFIVIAQLGAQGFNGTIEFRYTTQKDTSRNVYHIKNKMVRLDNYSRKKDNVVEGSFLFDLQTNEVKILSPKRKLWGIQKSETPQVLTGECVVTKGKGAKTIGGYKCSEYVVKNAEENTAVTYWIAQDKFTFFTPLIKLWNRKDKQSIYFGQIRNLPEGSMPLMSTEKQIDTGKTVTQLEVVKISKTAPPDQVFKVPADYTKFD
jgi:hypothetical protein